MPVTLRLPGRSQVVSIPTRRDKANALYREAAFALDARKTPGSIAGGNTLQDLSVNALRVANGSIGNAKIVQDGAGGKALQLHGNFNGFAATPDDAGFAPSTQLEAVFRIRAESTGTTQIFASQWLGGGGQFSWRVGLLSTGQGYIGTSTDGVSASSPGVFNTAFVGAIPDIFTSTLWLKYTFESDVGGFAQATLSYAADTGSSDVLPSSWTLHGTLSGVVAAHTLFNSTTDVAIGRQVGAFGAQGSIHRVILRTAIDGPNVRDFHPSRDASFTSLSWVSSTTGETWTITQGGTDGNDVVFHPFTGTRYVWLSGIANNRLQIAATTSHYGATALDLRTAVQLDDYTPASGLVLMGGANTAATSGPFRWFILATGVLRIEISDGAAWQVAQGGGAVPVADGGLILLRATWRASDQRVQFFTKAATEATARAAMLDNSGWTQLGTDLTLPGSIAGLASISTAFGLGGYSASGSSALGPGRMYAASLAWGIDAAPWASWGADDPVDAADTVFTAATGQAVTLDRTSPGYVATLVRQQDWSVGGDDYYEVPGTTGVFHPEMRQGVGGSTLRTIVLAGWFRTLTSTAYIAGTRNTTTSPTGSPGWAITAGASGVLVFRVADANGHVVLTTTITTDAYHVVALVFDQAAGTVTPYVDGVALASLNVAALTATTLSGDAFRFGRTAGVGVLYTTGGIRNQVLAGWNRALSAAEIRAITTDLGVVV